MREAVAALRRAVQLQPASADGWRLLADYLDADGDSERGRSSPCALIKAATQEPAPAKRPQRRWSKTICRARNAACARISPPSHRCRGVAHARRGGGAAAPVCGCQELLERCLELAPSFDAARHNYAVVLNRQAKPESALPQVERLLAKEPRNPGYLNLKAAILANLGEYSGCDRRSTKRYCGSIRGSRRCG